MAFKVVEADLFRAGEQPGLSNLRAFQQWQQANPQACLSSCSQAPVIDAQETKANLENALRTASPEGPALLMSFRG